MCKNVPGNGLSFYIFCSAALCPDPVDIEHGMVTFLGNSVGDTATYTCDFGFELDGDACNHNMHTSRYIYCNVFTRATILQS